MQRVVIDTNVLVSALIQRGYPFKIVMDIFFEKKFQLCISDELFIEYLEVLNRKKFSKYPDIVTNAKFLLTDIEARATKYFPKTKLKILKDVDDNKLLELSVECKASFLITGNTNDFTISNIKRTKIVSPTEYWEKHKPS